MSKVPKSDLMCPYTGQIAHHCNVAIRKTRSGRKVLGAVPAKYYRQRVACPECGRKLIPKVCLDGDQTCVLLYLVKHKRKGWWKIGKPRKVRR